MDKEMILRGIYKIENINNNKYYIGSSVNMLKRCKEHFSSLKNKKHHNNYLQASYNKHGKHNFKFEILEHCPQLTHDELLDKEQEFLNNSNQEKLFNLTMNTRGGGSDTQCHSVYLLDLKGNIIEEFKSIQSISRKFNKYINSTASINKSSIFNQKYRIVEPNYYNLNLEEILKWKDYSDKTVERSKNYKLKQIIIVTSNGIDIEFKNREDAALFLGIQTSRLSQILKIGNRKYNIRFKHLELFSK